MNEANQISQQTKLYGFIGEEAGKSSLSATMNRLFKANNKDAMTIPMNIREDDFYFTLSNMKKSHVNGAIISNEYVRQVVELLDESSEAVKQSGMCDILVRKEQMLKGDIFSTKVFIEFLKSNNVKEIALLGTTPHAKAFSFLSREHNFNISYFNDDLENLMNFTQEMQIQNPDINRISSNMCINFSPFDAVIDFSEMTNFEMVEQFSKLNLDMKQKTQFSPLKKITKELGAFYTSYDDLLVELAKGAADFFDKELI